LGVHEALPPFLTSGATRTFSPGPHESLHLVLPSFLVDSFRPSLSRLASPPPFGFVGVRRALGKGSHTLVANEIHHRCHHQSHDNKHITICSTCSLHCRFGHIIIHT
jgi:hypothetical protein